MILFYCSFWYLWDSQCVKTVPKAVPASLQRISTRLSLVT